MKDKIQNTEERIKDAARKVFIRKGFKGSTTRDIAKEAGINVALTNYYFRKKEKLFQIIFMEALHDFLNHLVEVLNQPIDLRKKLKLIVEKQHEIQKNNPDLLLFVYSEIRNNREGFLKEVSTMKNKFITQWRKQIEENVKKKNIRNIDYMSALSLVMGSIQFPVMSRPILQSIGGFTDKSYNRFLDKQVEYNVEMVTNYLFLKEAK